MVPPRRDMWIAWPNAEGCTAVTSTPWAPPVTLWTTSIGSSVQRIDHQLRAMLLGQRQLVVGDVDRGHAQAHGLGVLHRDVAESADTGDDNPLAGLGLGHLQALVDRDAGAQHRGDLTRSAPSGMIAANLASTSMYSPKEPSTL